MAKNMDPKPDDRRDNADKIEFNIGKNHSEYGISGRNDPRDR